MQGPGAAVALQTPGHRARLFAWEPRLGGFGITSAGSMGAVTLARLSRERSHARIVATSRLGAAGALPAMAFRINAIALSGARPPVRNFHQGASCPFPDAGRNAGSAHWPPGCSSP